MRLVVAAVAVVVVLSAGWFGVAEGGLLRVVHVGARGAVIHGRHALDVLETIEGCAHAPASPHATVVRRDIRSSSFNPVYGERRAPCLGKACYLPERPW